MSKLDNLTADEKYLLYLYRSLNSDGQEGIRMYIDLVSTKPQYSKKALKIFPKGTQKKKS